MEINKEAIEKAIVDQVARDLIGDDELYGRVKRAVDERIERHFREVADAQIRTAIEAAITSGFDREYRKISSFGQQDGPTTTIRAELERLIGGYWNCRVDSQGKPTESSYSSTSRAEYVMCKIVAADFEGEIKQHIVNLGGTLKDKLRGEVANTLNRLLSEVFHVQSAGDRELKNPGRSCIDPPQKAPV